MMLNAGQLNRRIAIQSLTVTRDAAGGFAESFATAATRWGRIEPMTGSEFDGSNRVQGEVTHKITLRHYDGLTSKHRLQYDGRNFNVVEVLNPGEANTATVLLAKEVTA